MLVLIYFFKIVCLRLNYFLTSPRHILLTPIKFKNHQLKLVFSSLFFLTIFNLPNCYAQARDLSSPGNFGLPGIIDLPTARRLPDGELIITQQIHRTLARAGLSFQALPNVGFSFRYSGHGKGGQEAYGRYNHDRSFDVHLLVTEETEYLPAISLGLRDFIGTGWYSSEYFVGTKSFGNLEVTAGIGFGRLAEKNTFANPLRFFSSEFENRKKRETGSGGTLGNIKWFQGKASAFYGISYPVTEKLTLQAEYTPDLMSREKSYGYLTVDSSWNIGAKYRLNDYLTLSAQHLYGNQLSFTANVNVNPARPPFPGGNELAPVPMRLRDFKSLQLEQNDEATIRKVLAADKFEVHRLIFNKRSVQLDATNVKFRSTAQAVGRIASTLQRFTSDNIETAEVHLYIHDLKVASYRIDLTKITMEQFGANSTKENYSSIFAFDADRTTIKNISRPFSWGIGPYVAHRLFNPDLPFSMETGIELGSAYYFAPGIKLSGSFRKSVLTNLTDNKRRSNSVLPRVQTDWPLYDFAGQNGHIHELTLSYLKNIAPGIYLRTHAGLLEPFFAGFGGEVLYKPAQSQFGLGFDIHHVKKRDYDMLFDLRDYETTIGHLSLYYDAGGIFNVEINAGRYLAGDWGATTTISRKFGSGWEVGGYATFTDVPFATFGEGSFDKAIYVSLPIDWILGTPNQTTRRLTLRPITRDGGANLAGARRLYRYLEGSQNAQFKRESGRLWK